MKAVDDVRTALLQVITGLVVLVGAYATWRQVRVSQEDLRLAQEGYLADRFSRAVDQLGSDKPDVRIGGFHALWRIAEQSDRDRDAVISSRRRTCASACPRPPAGPAAEPAARPAP
ncbi:hypothetical protein [Streptomyces thermolilacinus]|uniref:Uncharacterized protein n=1 Tax=Streptomyces thermolilacinus SPC6 TaxID=1306406 RepID=A0A1D3DR07_9ACTN|nr:hypothetical protein [Streptomyces thermolilacinus]OEJ94748.1 hypothetical protein J116_009940 [Streptomyces thermolilacinus SPC6]